MVNTTSAPEAVMMGLGYIGLPTAAVIASKGVRIHGVDVNEKIIDKLQKGEMHLVEPGLDDLIVKGIKDGFFTVGTQPVEAKVFLIAVPTPFKGNFEPDLRFVESAMDMIIPFLKKDDLVIIESTSPVGTTQLMYERTNSKRPELTDKINFAYCPERVFPGRIFEELNNNDRVIGGLNLKATDMAVDFYSKFVSGQLFKTDAKTAEMCKLTENAFRDLNIAFANELSIICDELGINVWELVKLTNRHPRVNILQAGVGVGGHCIAIDPWFIISKHADNAKLMRMARERNLQKTDWVIDKITQAVISFTETYHKVPKVCCMGLAFKPDIEDLRESPSVSITSELVRMGYDVIAVEPNIKNHQTFNLMDCNSAAEVADIIVFLTAHKEFKDLIHRLDSKIVLDFCNVMNI